MLDRDLAQLYEVQTKALKQAVNRNSNRFPEDFMFVLSEQEFADWRSQVVTSKSDKMGLRYAPMAFTEQGVAMLSSILNSERAIEVNIRIIRVFTRLRQMLLDNKGLRRELEEMKRTIDDRFQIVFQYLAVFKFRNPYSKIEESALRQKNNARVIGCRGEIVNREVPN